MRYHMIFRLMKILPKQRGMQIQNVVVMYESGKSMQIKMRHRL